MTSLQRISNDEFDELVAPLVGMRVTYAWRGIGTAVFLELGKLQPLGLPKDRKRNPRGEKTIMVEWSWRVERPRSVEFGTWSGDRKIDNGIASLKGTRVKSVSTLGELPELRVAFDDGRALQAFTTVESQPEWAVFLRDGSWLRVTRGRLHREWK